MAGVLATAEGTELRATEQERNRVAWNLPPQPVASKDRVLHDTQEPAGGTSSRRSKTTVPGLGIDRADQDATGRDLDWEGFVAAFFPGSRRHDLRAITAYGAYRRSGVFDERSATEGSRSKAADRASTGAAAVEAWEDEGGAAP